MTLPSKADCIAVLREASRLPAGTPAARPGQTMQAPALTELLPDELGMSCERLHAAALFLIERGCFQGHQQSAGLYAVGPLSLQGRLRLDQLANG